MEVFFYIPLSDMSNALECGLKLSRWAVRKTVFRGEHVNCMRALLNPRDDLEKYNDREYACLKLDIPTEKCFIAEGFFYETGMDELYASSIINAESYLFGMYRVPECIIMYTVLPDCIRAMDRRMDIPVLYSSSEELYVNNVIESCKENNKYFNDSVLYLLFDKMTRMGKMIRLDSSRENALFSDHESGKIYSVRIPDMFLE